MSKYRATVTDTKIVDIFRSPKDIHEAFRKCVDVSEMQVFYCFDMGDTVFMDEDHEKNHGIITQMLKDIGIQPDDDFLIKW